MDFWLLRVLISLGSRDTFNSSLLANEIGFNHALYFVVFEFAWHNAIETVSRNVRKKINEFHALKWSIENRMEGIYERKEPFDRFYFESRSQRLCTTN